MPYTTTSIFMVWLVFAVVIAAVVGFAPSGLGLMSLVVAALTAPALLLRTRGPVPIPASRG
jgi:hypothetical protein